MKILTLFIQYGNQYYPNASENLLMLYKKIGIVDFDLFIIDNALQKDFLQDVSKNIFLIGGDNHRREFSGWQKVIDQYRDQLHQYDLVNFVTSAFQNEYNGFYPFIQYSMLEWLLQNKTCVLSHIDSFPESVDLFGESFQAWACSKFIFLSPSLLTADFHLVSNASKKFFLNEPNEFGFSKNADPMKFLQPHP